MVQLVVDHPDGNILLHDGDVGQVVEIIGSNVGVDWGRPIGHNLEGSLSGGRAKCGWYVKGAMIEPFPDVNVQLDTDMLDSLLSGGHA